MEVVITYQQVSASSSQLSIQSSICLLQYIYIAIYLCLVLYLSLITIYIFIQFSIYMKLTLSIFLVIYSSKSGFILSSFSIHPKGPLTT